MTTAKTEYYLISTVLGGKVLTELTAAGTKKLTRVYVGSGVLAEQFGHGAGNESVVFKHQDIVTGSYQMTKPDGTLAMLSEPPSSMELEPLGGDIPTDDPVVEDDGIDPRPLASYQYAGDVANSETGCSWDGTALPCDLLGIVMQGQTHISIGVNIRSNGGWGLLSSLSNLVSTWRYDIRLGVNNEDPRLSVAQYNTPGILKDYKDLLPQGQTGLLVGTLYVQYISPFAEMVVTSSIQKRDDVDRSWSKPSRRLSRWEVETLKGSISSALMNSDDCKKYVGDLIAKVAENTGANIVAGSIEDLFAKVESTRGATDPMMGGISVYTVPSIVSNAISSWDWVGAPGFASIALGAGGGNDYIMTMLASPGDGGIKAIHELMHVAFSGARWAGSDRDFANAAADLAGENRLADKLDVSVYSKWWDDHLRQACGFPLKNAKTPYKLYK